MLPVWPSKVSSGFGLVDLMSKSLTVWWPAAARKRLSGEMHRRLTCESGCWIVREQMPERASQNLEKFVHKGQPAVARRVRDEGAREGGCELGGGLPYRVVVASWDTEVSQMVMIGVGRGRGNAQNWSRNSSYQCRE